MTEIVEPQAAPAPASTDWVPIWGGAAPGGNYIPQPVVNGQWVKGSGGAAIWAPIVAGDISSAVNGQWLKGAGGVATWSAITGADLSGLKVPVPLCALMRQTMSFTGGWIGVGDWPVFAGGSVGGDLCGPNGKYTQFRYTGHVYCSALNGSSDYTIAMGLTSPWVGNIWMTGGMRPSSIATGVFSMDSGWQTMSDTAPWFVTPMYQGNTAGGPPTVALGFGCWIR